MRTSNVRIKVTGALICTALVATSVVAQHGIDGLPEAKDPCYQEFITGSSQSASSSSVTKAGKPKVDFFQTQTRRKLSTCNFYAFAQSSPSFANSEKRELAKTVRSENFKFSQGPAAQPADDAHELAKKLSNPVAALISVPLQSNFDFGMGTGSGWRYTLNVQPVIPIKLNDKWNLISRTILPIIHQGNVTGPGTSQSGLGDITQSFFFSPNKSEPFIWAVGPVVLIPTATDSRLGTQKWGLGPTVLVLKQEHGWTYGILANHIWSVAGKSNRSSVNSTFLQPFLAYNTKDAWTYTINTESTYDWVTNSWAVPINPLVSKLVRFGKQPISFGGGIKCWVASPTGGPHDCSLRIVVTALFPKK